jgi:hypothetical protein
MIVWTCTAPAGGIPAATSSYQTFPAVVGPLAITRTGGGGRPDGVVDNALVYNISQWAIAAGAACVLARSTGGRYYVEQAIPNPNTYVNTAAGLPGSPGSPFPYIGAFQDPSMIWLGPLRF